MSDHWVKHSVETLTLEQRNTSVSVQIECIHSHQLSLTFVGASEHPETRAAVPTLSRGGEPRHPSTKASNGSRTAAASAVQSSREERSGEERVTVVRKHRTDEGTVGDNYHALLRLIIPHHAHIRRHIPTSAPPVLWLFYLLFGRLACAVFSLLEAEWKQQPRERSGCRRPGTGARCPLPQHPMMETRSWEWATGWTPQTWVWYLSSIPKKPYRVLGICFTADTSVMSVFDAVTRKSRLISASKRAGKLG